MTLSRQLALYDSLLAKIEVADNAEDLSRLYYALESAVRTIKDTESIEVLADTEQVTFEPAHAPARPTPEGLDPTLDPGDAESSAGPEAEAERPSGEFICDACGRWRPTKEALQYHIYAEHGGQPPELVLPESPPPHTEPLQSQSVDETAIGEGGGEPALQCTCGKCFESEEDAGLHLAVLHNRDHHNVDFERPSNRPLPANSPLNPDEDGKHYGWGVVHARKKAEAEAE